MVTKLPQFGASHGVTRRALERVADFTVFAVLSELPEIILLSKREGTVLVSTRGRPVPDL